MHFFGDIIRVVNGCAQFIHENRGESTLGDEEARRAGAFFQAKSWCDLVVADGDAFGGRLQHAQAENLPRGFIACGEEIALQTLRRGADECCNEPRVECALGRMRAVLCWFKTMFRHRVDGSDAAFRHACSRGFAAVHVGEVVPNGAEEQRSKAAAFSVRLLKEIAREEDVAEEALREVGRFFV